MDSNIEATQMKYHSTFRMVSYCKDGPNGNEFTINSSKGLNGCIGRKITAYQDDKSLYEIEIRELDGVWHYRNSKISMFESVIVSEEIAEKILMIETDKLLEDLKILDLLLARIKSNESPIIVPSLVVAPKKDATANINPVECDTISNSPLTRK